MLNLHLWSELLFVTSSLEQYRDSRNELLTAEERVRERQERLEQQKNVLTLKKQQLSKLRREYLEATVRSLTSFTANRSTAL